MIKVKLKIAEDIKKVGLKVDSNTAKVNLKAETIITKVPNNYGLITWNGQYLTVS